MDDEILEIVDQENRIVGSARRKDIHEQGLRHRAVHVLIFNLEGRFFLQKRSMAKDTNPGLWDTSAAGHVEPGESYLNCAVREVAEELGITGISSLEALFLLPAEPKTGMEFCQVYRFCHNGPFDLNPEEIETGQWFTLNEIDAWFDAGGEGLTSIFELIWMRARDGIEKQKPG